MQMIERVGLALLNDDRTRNGFPPVDALSHLNDGDADAYRGSARAAIEAMREPTPDMTAAALAALDNVTVRNTKAAAWDWSVAHRAAITAALTDQGEGA